MTELNPLHIWQRGRMPLIVHDRAGAIPGHHQWYGTDSYEQYLECGNKAFGVDDVSYDFNLHGYRSKEFSQINHNAFKILTVGCSETLGVGIPLHLTFGEQLVSLIRQKFAIDSEVINLGAGGRSLDYITRALFQSIPVLQPHYVFCLVPQMARREYILNAEYPVTVPFSMHTIRPVAYYEALATLSTDIWDFFCMLKNINMIELILRDTCWSWDTWMVKGWKLPGFEAYFDLTHYRNQSLSWHLRDKARDNIHNGVPYHTYIANDLIDDPFLTQAIDRYLSL